MSKNKNKTRVVETVVTGTFESQVAVMKGKNDHALQGTR